MGTRPQNHSSNNQFSAVQERLINDFAPPTIVVNELLDAIHVYGDVSEFIRGFTPGKLTNNIKEIIQPELRMPVSTALLRCEKESQDVYYKEIRYTNSKGESKANDLSVVNIFSSPAKQSSRFIAIQFIDNDKIDTNKHLESAVTYDISKQSQQRIQDLENELVRKQEHLPVTVEKLETTNEELQSTNEELYTVNSEYQEKIVQLTQANSDLDSVLNATDIGIIFLDRELTIRKYTPKAMDYVNLRYEDLNRPFHHISHELRYDDLLSDVAYVLANNQSKEKDTTNKSDQSVLVRIIPYTNKEDGTTDGVLITITNISRLRFVESALQRAQDQLRQALLNQSDRRNNRALIKKEIRIGLLEDDAAERTRIIRMINKIKDRKFTTSIFETIDDALQSTITEQFDIFLVDYSLGDGTAKDFLHGLKMQQTDIPIVLISGYSEDGIDADFIADHVADFLNKDELSGQLLIRSIDYALERRDINRVMNSMQH